jgi:hypothetical protein
VPHARVSLLALIAVVALVGCGGPSEPLATADAPISANQVDGIYRLTLQLDRRVWAAGEPIVGRATLATAADSLFVYGGRFTFEFQELDGLRSLPAVHTLECDRRELGRAEPWIASLPKPMLREIDDPAALREFRADPAVRVPAGTWDITATVTFYAGVGCEGALHELTARVRIAVVP